jgi:archaeal flagellin FlaB
LTPKTSFGNDSRAEVGVGTMIVFIASILVAAIAAGVLISTSQKLQSKSLDTGNQATLNVVGTLSVLYIQGVRSGTTSADLIDQLDLTVQLAAGSDPVDLSTMVIYIHDGTNEVVIDTCVPGGAVAADNEFAMNIARGAATDCGNILSGDLVYFHLGLAGGAPVEVIPGGIAENSQVTIRMVPQHGTPVLVAFTVPAFGSGERVILW